MTDQREIIHVRPKQRDIVRVEPRELAQFGIKLGIPSQEPERDIHEAGWQGYYTVPHFPHVMYAQRIEFQTDRKQTFTIDGGMVMIGHGIDSEGLEDTWVFTGTGKNVSVTVNAYEAFAKDRGYPPLDALIVCREQPNLKAGVQFSYREIPYIRADSTAIVRGDTPNGRIFTQGEGVENMVATAREWRGIERWRHYWDHAAAFRQTREIPLWAKMSSSN